MAQGAVSIDQIFDPQFLEELHGLRLVASRVAQGGRYAEQRSRDLGHGLEFRDFRPYAPGDDLRGVDWNIYQRLHRVFLRQFEEFEDLPLYVLPDISESMFAEDPPRALAGLRTSLALAAISLAQHDSVGLFPFHSKLDLVLKPTTGRTMLMTVARALAELVPGGQTDLAAAVRGLQALRLREGLVVIISDFFDPRGLEPMFAELSALRHRLLFVQLVRSTDRDPGVTGELRLVDCETQAIENVSVTESVLRRYREAYGRFQDQLTNQAEQRGAGLIQLDVEQPIVKQLATLFERGVYRT
ncbi:MAG: DUF58 domain-containing protein [Planctomycetota bacterium]|nr:DUF58 domain-containing protein [Planctomycetota bacterium]